MNPFLLALSNTEWSKNALANGLPVFSKSNIPCLVLLLNEEKPFIYLIFLRAHRKNILYRRMATSLLYTKLAKLAQSSPLFWICLKDSLQGSLHFACLYWFFEVSNPCLESNLINESQYPRPATSIYSSLFQPRAHPSSDQAKQDNLHLIFRPEESHVSHIPFPMRSDI